MSLRSNRINPEKGFIATIMDIITILLIVFIMVSVFNPVCKFVFGLWNFLLMLCISTPIDLKKKFGDWAVITGCTDGIGKEYAKELARNDLNLVLISRTLEKLNQTKDEILQINPSTKIKIIQVDFSKGQEEFKKIEPQLKEIPVGILVNNVGTLTEFPKYLDEISEEELWNMINVNVATATIMTRLVIENMKLNRKGAIVNVSSTASFIPIPLFQVYAASKIYVSYFSDAIREEFSQYGLTVQCIKPSYVNTKMIAYTEKLTKAHQLICPTACTYVKHAILTLGRINSTTGYWPHEMQILGLSILPTYLGIKLTHYMNRIGRRDYFTLQKRKDISKD